jgi:hypothetical protein
MAKIEEPPLLELSEAAEIGANEAPIYDESRTVDPDFLRDVTEAIEAANAERMRALAGRLHEADLGLFTASPEPELRPLEITKWQVTMSISS